MQNNKELITATKVFQDEIEGLIFVKNNLDEQFITSVNILCNCSGKIIVTGVGKSGHIAKKIAATLASTGSAAFFIHPTEALHGDLGMISDNDVIIAISYSGQNDELLTILPIVKRRNIPIIAITGNCNSQLAKISNTILNISIPKEACPMNLAPTTSTTATLVLGDALAICLLTKKGFKETDFALSHPGGSLGRKLLTTNRDIMHSQDKLPQVFADSALSKIVLEISTKSLGFTAVVNEHLEVIGIITDGDLRRLMDKSFDFNKIQAKDIMTKNPKVVFVDDLAINSVKLMENFHINGFLVTDENNKLIGAFNLHDLIHAKLL